MLARRFLVVGLGLIVACNAAPGVSDGDVVVAQAPQANSQLDETMTELADTQSELDAIRAELAAAEVSIEEADQEIAELTARAEAAESEASELRATYDPEIRAALQSELDAELVRACDVAKVEWETPVAGLVRWNSDWELIGTRSDLVAAVEACAASERAKSAEEREGERLASCVTVAVDEIEKDPDAFSGSCVHMWGYIVQWDANTGTCSFRAELAARYDPDWFEYGGNNYLAAGNLDSCPELDGIDNNDFIEFWATGEGALTYDTSIGGSATAALWTIEKVVLLKKG